MFSTDMKNVRRKLTHVRPSFSALVVLWREEFSFKLQTACAAIAIIVSLILRISAIEFPIVILIIGAVLAVEALNTAIEEVCNHVTPDHHPQIGKIKDLASGASGIIQVTAAVVGLLIFIPHLLALV